METDSVAIDGMARTRLGRAQTVIAGMEIVKVCEAVDGFAVYRAGESDRTVWERYRARDDARPVSVGTIGNLRHELFGPIAVKPVLSSEEIADKLDARLRRLEMRVNEIALASHNAVVEIHKRLADLEQWASDGARGCFPPLPPSVGAGSKPRHWSNDGAGGGA